MATYAEYLRSMGATDEDIKVLDIPVARKAFEAKEAEAEAARKSQADYKANADKWYQEEVVPKFTDMQQKTVLAEAEAAKARAIIQASTDAGLLEIAKKAGYDKEVLDLKNAGKPADDFNKDYVNNLVKYAAEKEGEGIAIAQDIAFEHSRLFPDKPLNFRELRRDAVAADKSVEQLWMERYNVAAARESRDKAAKEAYETKLREEGAAAERAKFASEYGNPATRPMMPSHSPFVNVNKEKREKQPWEVADNERSDARVRFGTQKAIERGAVN